MKSKKLLKITRLIEGEKVCLEPFSYKRMLKFYDLYRTSHKHWEQFIVLHFQGIEDVKKFIAQQQRDSFVGYFILEKKSYKPIGFILGDEISASEMSLTRAIGVSYEGRGYAYEARKLLEQALRDAGYASIVSFCDAENRHSKELLQRDNYVQEGSQRLAFGPVSMELEVYRKIL